MYGEGIIFPPGPGKKMFPRCGSELKCSQHSGCKQRNLNKYQRAAMKCQLLSWTKRFWVARSRNNYSRWKIVDLTRTARIDRILTSQIRRILRVLPLVEHTGGVRAMAVLPDSRRIVTVDENGLHVLWDLDTNKMVRKFSFPMLPM